MQVTESKTVEAVLCPLVAVPYWLEACGGAHYWSRELTRLGHTVRMMALAFVKPYLKSNKNDRNDAAAICEAVQRPSMRFVQPKTPEQQTVLHLHHGRQLLVRRRVALGNHLRGVLSEYGIVLPQGVKVITRHLPALLEDGDNELPMLARHLLAELKAEHDQLIERIDRIEAQLKAWHTSNDNIRRHASILGIGVLTATALAATVGDAGTSRMVVNWRPTWGWFLAKPPRAARRGCWASANGGTGTCGAC